jgi:hypothetical protein
VHAKIRLPIAICHYDFITELVKIQRAYMKTYLKTALFHCEAAEAYLFVAFSLN